jgi:hypothetical protein
MNGIQYKLMKEQKAKFDQTGPQGQGKVTGSGLALGIRPS